jgi:hypothetical protein
MAPIATVGVLAATASPASAATRAFCTGMTGTVNFKQTAAPATLSGLTQLGYFETAATQSNTTVGTPTNSHCYPGTATGATHLATGTLTLPTIKTYPCHANTNTNNAAHTTECKLGATVVPLPPGDTGKYWYGSGWAFDHVGVSALVASVPTITFHIAGHVLVFHTKAGEAVLTVHTPSSLDESGFGLWGYTVDTTNGTYNDGSAGTCTSETTCPSKVLALLNTDTGVHLQPGYTNVTGKFLEDISQILSYTTQPPGNANTRSVGIYTSALDSALQANSTCGTGNMSTCLHGFYQS